MKIKVLGAHNTESLNTRHTCLLVDNILALDAGGLTSGLSFEDQLKIKAVMITHAHYDHIRDIPALAMNLFLRLQSVNVYTHQAVYDILTQYLLNGDLYPEFHLRPEGNPALRFHILEPYRETTIEGYRVLPIPVTHAISASGYQITSNDNKSIFYTGDTGAGLSESWKHISPQVLFIELTAPNRWEESARRTGHLTPELLKEELSQFRDIKDYLPRVIAVHINPTDETTTRTEVAAVANALGTSIELAYEGMEVEV